MSTNGISESYFYENRPAQERQTGQNVLGKDDFLRLLLAQLSNQDPLNPMEDREFIAQMAQFSSLEQMTNMSSSMQRFVDMQMSQTLVQHSELIGKEVKWMRYVDVDEYRQHVEYADNLVTSVRREGNGTIRLQLDDGRWISSEQLVQVSKAADKNEENKGGQEGAETGAVSEGKE
ncbi:flagellar hook assembly protein FlgD [Halalkalibacterium ligniniphilum]|uniref:flagellar hook assembly protein FlgD n=1 Tax=Halalkalibacterium ligniniphilum TaxID=1134413 RepID=UPI00034B1CB7|nr:flagellar hook assembly protein FlgD [Halalkalibacterium ligniniphilum]